MNGKNKLCKRALVKYYIIKVKNYKIKIPFYRVYKICLIFYVKFLFYLICVILIKITYRESKFYMLSGRMFARGVNITDLRGTISTRMSRTGGTHISHQDAADEAKSC